MIVHGEHHFGMFVESPPISFQHEAGQLRIEDHTVRLSLSPTELCQTSSQSDVFCLQYRLADRDGRVHAYDCWVSAGEIWRMLAGQFAYDESTYKQYANGFPKRSTTRLHTLIDGALIQGDENGWVFCWRRELQPGLWSQVPCYARNKAFCTRLDLFLSLTQQRSDGIATPWFHARVRPSHGNGVLGFEQLEAEGPDVTTDDQHLTTGDLWFEIPATRLVWRSGLRRCDRPINGPEWREHPRDPIIFHDTGTTGSSLRPNEGVYLKTD